MNFDKLLTATALPKAKEFLTIEDSLLNIVSWQKNLMLIDVEGVEPLFNTLEMFQSNTLNPDIVENSDSIQGDNFNLQDNSFVVKNPIANGKDKK